MKGTFVLDVVIREGTTILKLLTSVDETLMVRRNAFLVLNLGLNIVGGVRRLDFKSDSLASQSLNENLHTTMETKNKVKSGLLLNVKIRKGSAVFNLLASEDKTLLIRGDAFLVLDLHLHAINGVTGFHP